MIQFRTSTICAAILATALIWQAADADQPLWKPAADYVYLQELGEKLATDAPVTQTAIHDGTIYAATGGSLHRLTGTGLVPVAEVLGKVVRMEELDGALWVSTTEDVQRLANGKWSRVHDQPMVDLCMHRGAVHGATSDDIFRWDGKAFVNIKPDTGFLSNDSTVIMADGSQVLSNPVRIGPINRIASYSDTLYILQPGRIALLNGSQFVRDPIDWGLFPSRELRDFVPLGSRLYVGTGKGLSVLRGMALTTITGDEGLPYEDLTCLEEGFDGDLWIGTTTGAIRKVGDDFHYFGAHHWLPGDNVHDIAVGDRVVVIGTDAGLGIIRYEPYTLRKKADYFEQVVDAWGHKRLGFVHKLFWSGDENGWLREISDNDGGHTAHYLAAMSFKYAVTKDEADRQNALDAFQAMIWLDAITPKDGFIARAIWSPTHDKGHRSTQGSGGLPAKWYESDDGLWEWKGDTSSDEVNAHIYAVALFHDLVAKDGPEKDRAARHIANIATHIIDNGWVLMDMDGEPTRWGRWDPEYLLRPYGFEARGLNGMEAQTYMWAAHALDGDPKFKAGLDQLMKWGYHTYTVRQKFTFPPDGVVPWDDELAFRCYEPLLRYTDDPVLRSIYLRSIERSWEVMRLQKLPFFNFIYGAATGNDCEVEEAVQHLREWSLDHVSHSFRNSHRADLASEPGYVPYSGGTRAISPRESACMWGSRSAIVWDGGGGGRSAAPPVGWLEDYWMGRYHGFILPPETNDANLTSLPADSVPKQGAAPFDGPSRPAGLIDTK